MAMDDQRVFGKLVALAYNKEDLLCWRAIEAFGACAAAVAGADVSRVRNVAQRILWSAREESGGMGWSAPELLAEVVCASPKQFADLPPIIVSLHVEDEEKVFLKGVLWAIARMAAQGVRDVAGAEEVMAAGLKDSDPQVKGLAALAASRTRLPVMDSGLKSLADDESIFTLYEDGQLVQKSVSSVAREALAQTR